jgi:hypothetical protein
MSARILYGFCTVYCKDCDEYLGTYDTEGEAQEKTDDHNKERHPDDYAYR